MDSKLDNLTKLHAERSARAKVSKDALSTRATQYELYADIVFPKDHIVGGPQAIPLQAGEILLAAGHLDPLYQLGLINKSELYKVSDTQLTEGLQTGSEHTITLRESINSLMNPDQSTLTLKKPADQVVAKVNIAEVLNREALTHPDVQTIFMHLLEQQTGSLGLSIVHQYARRKFLQLLKQPGFEADIRYLMTETEIDSRRIVRQLLAIRDVNQQIKASRPELADIYKLGGQKLFTERIDELLAKELGENVDQENVEDILQNMLKKTFAIEPAVKTNG